MFCLFFLIILLNNDVPERINERIKRYPNIITKSYIYVEFNENNMYNVTAVIIGPKDTPYENGIFCFSITIPDNYPFSPPKILLKNTNFGTIRYNPNLYKDGKVCLSILGTWDGPEWSPAMTIKTVLISIQSLLNENPCFNEPDIEGLITDKECQIYNLLTCYRSMKYAGVKTIKDYLSQLPIKLQDIVKNHFKNNYQRYIQICESNMSCDGIYFYDFYNDDELVSFHSVREEMKALYDTL